MKQRNEKRKNPFLIFIILFVAITAIIIILSLIKNKEIKSTNSNQDNLSTITYRVNELPDFEIQYNSDWEKQENISYSAMGSIERIDLTLKKYTTEVSLVIYTDFLGGLETSGFCFDGKEYLTESLTPQILRYKGSNNVWIYEPGELLIDEEERKTHSKLIFSDTYENCVATVDGIFTDSSLTNPQTQLPAKGMFTLLVELNDEDLMDEVDAIIKSIRSKPL